MEGIRLGCKWGELSPMLEQFGLNQVNKHTFLAKASPLNKLKTRIQLSSQMHFHCIVSNEKFLKMAAQNSINPYKISILHTF